ncbi:tRNA (adenosine(37)-N6)-dimethylallyltransferase MiaA [Nesterenkonia haasae]|uniref:tRNA (adenosine(37)-N6)-dimethylallyltransferase MiaA n=1 Tax=Nesterenkonia haasae TaxID=2587813 RepID=UPI0013914A69|nr:tRNA (adenosine(37)-N6)-dimethylallyltransferase MiaA [Nesterenkonia haasae]NDK33056.1 tRNA (adenosine(37)-N6)-dimethylallyltransferase MiaA [Nesterenkonia haasae]
MEQSPLVAVVGATASGKTGLSLELARRLNGEVINADSMQLYRGMNIGTAKITPQEAQGVPHHLLDVLHVTEEASVATYQARAREVIAEIRSRGKTPIMVGGSGLYIRAALDTIEFPPTDSQLRAQIQAQLNTDGAAALRAELRDADPETAAVIKDERRLVRAVEVVRLTGRTFTSFMPQRAHEPSLTPVVQLGLRIDRPLLHERIAARVQQMRTSGLLDEVRALDAAGLRSGRTASAAIGYQQFLRVIDGMQTEEDAVEDTIVATRKFARRQETWFRADPRTMWLDSPDPTIADRAMEAIQRQAG